MKLVLDHRVRFLIHDVLRQVYDQRRNLSEDACKHTGETMEQFAAQAVFAALNDFGVIVVSSNQDPEPPEPGPGR